MEGSHTIQLSRGCLPSFPSFFVSVLFGGEGVWRARGGLWGFGALVCLPSSPHFPSCSCCNSVFIFAPWSLWSGARWCRSNVCCACRDWSGDWSARQCFNFQACTPRAQHDHRPTPPTPLLFTLLRKFLLPLPRRKWELLAAAAPSRPEDSQHLATCLVGSPGAPHRSTNWLLLRKGEKKQWARHSAVSTPPFVVLRADKRCIKRTTITYSFSSPLRQATGAVPWELFFLSIPPTKLCSLTYCVYCWRTCKPEWVDEPPWLRGEASASPS